MRVRVSSHGATMVDALLIKLTEIYSMENNNLTDDSQPAATHVDAGGEQSAVAETLSLAEINSTLGKDFKDKATALKSLRDTQSYVGKKIDAVSPAPAVDNSLKSEVDSLKEQVFYASHPELKGHESIIKAMGSNPAEVVEGEAFKTYFEKAKVADEVANQKSVVSSNSRLSQSKTVLDEGVQMANARGTTGEDVATVFARAINQANNG